jgi:ATP-dependent DNA ligase
MSEAIEGSSVPDVAGAHPGHTLLAAYIYDVPVGAAEVGWGLRLVEHMEGDGPIIFKHSCKLKLEGIVSKRKDLGYRSGPSKTWLKTKNPMSPAALRVIEDNAVW